MSWTYLLTVSFFDQLIFCLCRAFVHQSAATMHLPADIGELLLLDPLLSDQFISFRGHFPQQSKVILSPPWNRFFKTDVPSHFLNNAFSPVSVSSLSFQVLSHLLTPITQSGCVTCCSVNVSNWQCCDFFSDKQHSSHICSSHFDSWFFFISLTIQTLLKWTWDETDSDPPKWPEWLIEDSPQCLQGCVTVTTNCSNPVRSFCK